MSHAAFVAAAYLATGIVLLALVAWVFLDGRAQQRRLADLESRGIRRRSAGRGATAEGATVDAAAGEESRA